MLEIERNFQVADIRQIDLRIAMGDLSLTTGGDQVALRARVRSNDETELETTVANGVLLVKNRSDNGWLGRGSSRIDVALTVPREATIAVAVKTGMGDVNVEGVAGLYEVHTGKGDVRAVDGSSPLTIKTGKGDILVRSWRGDLSVTTGKGDVVVSGLTGALQMATGAGDTSVEGWQAVDAEGNQIKTGSGDVTISIAQAQGLKVSTGRGDCTLRRVGLDSLRGQTGMGSFAIEGDPRQGRWEVRTGKGDISLALPALAAARVEAATRHGKIQSSLPQVKVARPGPASPHGGRTIVVIGEEPRGDVQLDTGKGDINIRAAGAMEPPLPTVTVQQPADARKEALYAVRIETADEPPQLAQTGSGHSSALTILESLSRGEISVDEAEALLRTLDQ